MLKFLGLLPILFLFVADVTKTADKTNKKDEDLFQGKWTAVRLVEEGQEWSEEETRKFSFLFDGDRVHAGGELAGHKFRLDASKRPKWITIDDDEIEGIYELDGDTLLICTNKSEDAGRPTSFTPTPVNKWTLAALKRKGK
jgi:uncharacterized protein (TIGR03067 family)